MVLTAYSVLSPVSEFRLVTVIGELKLIKPVELDFASASLASSNGCRDHTALPSA